MFQGIVALKANEATIQMHRVSGSCELAKHSLTQFNAANSGLPVIRINQRMRMETNQLETVRNKMNDERSYVALVCLACGKDKDDIRHQSEVLKERFVDYLISKVAAGICNLGNERHPVPDSIVHVFPPCNFAAEFLRQNASDLFDTIQQQAINYLFVVITAAN